MLDFFVKYKKLIFRISGIVLLVVGFAVHFWETPKKGYTKEEYAAANVARMEASIAGHGSAQKSSKPDSSVFLREFKNSQEKQVKYFTIMAMILGVLFLIYSFVKKE